MPFKARKMKKKIGKKSVVNYILANKIHKST